MPSPSATVEALLPALPGRDRIGLDAGGGDPLGLQEPEELAAPAADVEDGTREPREKREIEPLLRGDVFGGAAESLLEQAVETRRQSRGGPAAGAGRPGPRDGARRRRRPFERRETAVLDRRSPLGSRGAPAARAVSIRPRVSSRSRRSRDMAWRSAVEGLEDERVEGRLLAPEEPEGAQARRA